MRSFLAVLAAIIVSSGVAHAQPAAAAPSKGYVEGVAQSAFGNVTSQSFGVEGGVAVAGRLQVFGEVGKVRDTSPKSIGANAQLMAGFLSQTQSNVAFSVRQPATFGIGGVRYAMPSGRIEPYVMAGAGMASVKRDVKFTVGATDVTSTLETLGVKLGTDLSGSETKPMISFGGGVAWAGWQRLVVDLQFRYGRILTESQGLNVARAGIGVGVRF